MKQLFSFLCMMMIMGMPLNLMAQAPQTATLTPPVVTPPPYGRNMSLSEAKEVMKAAEEEAKKNGWAVVISIVEPNGALVLMQKMDGTQYGSIEVAQKKAETAARFKRPTSFFQTAVKNGTLNAIFAGALAIEGGELIIKNNQVIGAIGVSGVTPAQDGQIAKAGVMGLK